MAIIQGRTLIEDFPIHSPSKIYPTVMNKSLPIKFVVSRLCNQIHKVIEVINFIIQLLYIIFKIKLI